MMNAEFVVVLVILCVSNIILCQENDMEGKRCEVEYAECPKGLVCCKEPTVDIFKCWQCCEDSHCQGSQVCWYIEIIS